MQQNIVMVVHGIGEQRPGESIDSLVGAATEMLGLAGRISGHTELLVDSPSDARQMQTFPCSIRRSTLPARCGIGSGANTQEQEVLAAEVYWADLSAAPHGLFSTVKDLLHTVLALGYLALDNVDFTRARALPRWLVAMFVRLFYLAIAPCNALMLLGSVVLLTIDFTLSDSTLKTRWPAVIALAAWAIATAASLRMARRMIALNRSYLAALFWQGCTYVAGALVLWTAAQALWGSDATGLMRNTAFALVLVMILAWGAALTLLALMAAEALVFWLRSAPLHPRAILARWRAERRLGLSDWLRVKQAIYIPACSAMLILWTLLSASFWTALSGSAVKLLDINLSQGLFRAIYAENLPRATGTLTYIMSGMIAILVAIIAIMALRHLRRDGLAQGEGNGRADVWLGRIIVNPVIGMLLFALVFWIGIGAIRALWNLFGQGDTPAPNTTAALLAASILGTLIVTFHSQLGAGLGVARDVASYSIRSLHPGVDGRPNYPVRNDMLHRFDLVLTYLRGQMPDATRLIVISHSQGTVIATTALATQDDLPDQVHLITMGSPVGHIYQQYFPIGFPLEMLPGKLDHWMNIYRGDDFVGTTINSIAGVENIRVNSGGHLNYWTDAEVWDKALSAISICALPDQMGPDQNGTSSSPPTG